MIGPTFVDPVLRFDGDDDTTSDGFTYQLEIGSDWFGGEYGQDDCDMEVAPCVSRYGEHTERPAGFDGAAMKIRLNNGDIYWAQPRFEVWGLSRRDWHNDSEMRRREYQHAKNVLEDGYLFVSVTMTAPDGWTTSGSLGGVDSDADDVYMQMIVDECVGECQSEYIFRLRRRAVLGAVTLSD